ncbi:hypothetical protein FY528_02940 [Hymenobacter lutimineralis]|uniref:Uncharacterized protein n=1 Tax=Hymenobacter lutimineralis TaxID=2606448 RepID=A0A5D6VDW6_9BACT|nr:hypothetical protein [Hymenobacter lutimineralis]TYZ13382.1 hypothetical protein FY528_02940 [Hymenobacter lutimineralis]
MSAPAYYQPSGRFTVSGVLLLVILGTAAAVPLAFVYVYAIWYIPFIYINLFVTLGFGLLLGYALKTLTKSGKLRSPALVGWLSFALALWAWYLQWCVYLTLLFGAGETESLGSRASFTHTTFEADVFLGTLLNPPLVLGMLPRLADEGTWSIFGVTISGIFLYLVWLAELLILVLLTWNMPRSQAEVPFSELADEWAEKITLPQPATPFADAAATKLALETADWNHLQPHTEPDGTAHFGRLHFFRAPSDPDCCFLSLENVAIETDNKGKASEKTTDVLEYLRVPPRVCQELSTRFGAVPA